MMAATMIFRFKFTGPLQAFCHITWVNAANEVENDTRIKNFFVYGENRTIEIECFSSYWSFVTTSGVRCGIENGGFYDL